MFIINRTIFKILSRGRCQNFTTQTLKCNFPRRRIYVNSTNQCTSTQINWTSTKDEHKAMMALWTDVVHDLTEAGDHLELPEVKKWILNVLQYNGPYEKKLNALLLVYAYKVLAPKDQLTEENIRLSRILAWSVELLQSFFNMEDDIIDGGLTRGGHECWYLHNNLGLSAIKDGLLVERTIYELLRIHFKDKPCYVDLLETFYNITFKTVIGQIVDTFSTQFGQRPNFDLFTEDRYKTYVRYKSSYLTFIVPVMLATQLAGIDDPEIKRQINTICYELGPFFQSQDDYLDVYGDPNITGTATDADIKEGKINWLAVLALQSVTPSQRKIFEEYYGYDDEEKVARIKQLYEDLEIPKIYTIWEEKNYNLIKDHIQQMSYGVLSDLFFKVLSKIYRRIY